MAYVSRLLLCTSLLALAGCSGMSDTLGLGRSSPDEFAVIDRPPLSLPPDFSLRPPEPGAPRPQEVSMPHQAETTLFGKAIGGTSEASSVESALLNKAGADKTEANIRELIDRESSQKVVGSRHLVEELLWGQNADGAITVDAQAEAERLRETKEKGESVTSGATPVIEKNKKSWLGSLLD
ncbi:MAG: DUF3035 domain-containing protein [Bdellovibrionales bacterium]